MGGLLLELHNPRVELGSHSRTATSTVHSKLDYCNNLYHNLPKCQITRLQQIQNSLARAVVKAPKFSHTTPVLRSLHWLKITERIEYKLLSLTYKVLTTTQPSYLYNLIAVQPPGRTRSSSLVTLTRLSTSSSQRITDRSFQYAPGASSGGRGWKTHLTMALFFPEQLERPSGQGTSLDTTRSSWLR